jgi:N-acetyl sugar amidotransferase
MTLGDVLSAPDRQICKRCIYDERVGGINFDEDGVCNYCKQIDALTVEYGTGTEKGNEKFGNILAQIREDGRNKKYDCVIGVSGGTDSSFLLHLTKDWGLRPLAVHYDNTWNSAVSTENIRKVLSKLDIDLYTHVVDNQEVDDIFRSFFLADVLEIDASTDLALAEVMYRAAWKYKVKYVLEGHSFITEGISPISKNYFDGKYVRSIHKIFGRKKMRTYPLMTISRFLFWTMFANIQKIRPLWYIDYNKEDARKFLEKTYDWQYYGGHHLENRMSAYAHSVYLPFKFNTDMRNNTLSALVRNGRITRELALEEYEGPPIVEKGLVEYFKKRLGLSSEEYEAIMTFYIKYCFPIEKTNLT